VARVPPCLGGSQGFDSLTDRHHHHAEIAQTVERRVESASVADSISALGTIFTGRLAERLFALGLNPGVEESPRSRIRIPRLPPSWCCLWTSARAAYQRTLETWSQRCGTGGRFRASPPSLHGCVPAWSKGAVSKTDGRLRRHERSTRSASASFINPSPSRVSSTGSEHWPTKPGAARSNRVRGTIHLECEQHG
jgi:hypothetical protein